MSTVITRNLYSLRIETPEAELFTVYTYDQGRVSAPESLGVVGLHDPSNIDFLAAVTKWVNEITLLFHESIEPTEQGELEAEFTVRQGVGEIVFTSDIGSDGAGFTGEVTWDQATGIITAAPRPAFDISWSNFLYWYRASLEHHKLIKWDVQNA